jgi:hypothetical protein
MLDYAFAQSHPTEPPDSKLNVIKLDTSGNVIWNKIVGPLRWAYNMNIINELPNGNIVAVGYFQPDVGVGLATIFMLNPNGDTIWMRDYKKVLNSGSTNRLYSIQQTSDNGFIACGQVFGAWEPPNGQNMWLLKMDSFGCLVPNCTGVNIIEPLLSNSNIKIYPNPASDNITINLTGLKNLSGLCLNIYNIQGQLLLQQTLNQNNTEIDISQLEQGVYVAKIKLDDGSVLQEKFVVVK